MEKTKGMSDLSKGMETGALLTKRKTKQPVMSKAQLKKEAKMAIQDKKSREHQLTVKAANEKRKEQSLSEIQALQHETVRARIRSLSYTCPDDLLPDPKCALTGPLIKSLAKSGTKKQSKAARTPFEFVKATVLGGSVMAEDGLGDGNDFMKGDIHAAVRIREGVVVIGEGGLGGDWHSMSRPIGIASESHIVTANAKRDANAWVGNKVRACLCSGSGGGWVGGGVQTWTGDALLCCVAWG